MAKTKEQITKEEKHIDEVTSADSKQRARDMVEYEQMLMAFINSELNGVID